LLATRFINLLTICIAVLSHAAYKDSFSRILMLGSNFNCMSIKRCKDVCMSMTYYLRSICLPIYHLRIVSSTRILMSFFNSSHISSVMADDVLAHVIYDFSFLSRFFFTRPQFIAYYLIALRVLPLRITGIMNPAAVWGAT